METMVQGTIYLVTKCAPTAKHAELMEQAKSGKEMETLQYLMSNCKMTNDDKMYLMDLLQ